MLDCGSAILIFTKDEKFIKEGGEEIWRPSENVVHELGAASFQYEDRIVIFKEKGITLPSNYASIGHIEFEYGAIEAKTMDLLQELIGFKLVTITPARSTSETALWKTHGALCHLQLWPQPGVTIATRASQCVENSMAQSRGISGRTSPLALATRSQAFSARSESASSGTSVSTNVIDRCAALRMMLL
jgi:hypothetical protein